MARPAAREPGPRVILVRCRTVAEVDSIESLNARYRRAIQGPGPFSDRAGGAKVPVPGPPVLDPTGTGQTRWTTRWKPALNAFAITFNDRFPAAETC
jgi:putative transposase